MPDPPIPLPPDWPKLTKSGIVHAIALAHFVLTYVRGWCANSRIARVRLAAERDILRNEVALLQEERRIKDERMGRIPAPARPRYVPADRLAILELQATRSWSTEETSRHFLLTRKTITSWTRRREEQGEAALVSTRPPVNRFPDFVGDTVQELKASCPTMGRKRIANTLARAGLHLAPSTAQRMINRGPPPPRPAAPPAKATSVLAEDVRNLDLTPVSAHSGHSTPWLLCAVFAVLDRLLSVVAGFAVFGGRPSSEQVCAAQGSAIVVIPTTAVRASTSRFDAILTPANQSGHVEPRARYPTCAPCDDAQMPALSLRDAA